MSGGERPQIEAPREEYLLYFLPFPDLRMLQACGALLAAAVLVLLLPILWVLLALSAFGLLALAVWDFVLIRRSSKVPLRVERSVPARVFEGREAAIALQITNLTSEALELEVIDEVPADLNTDEPRFGSVDLASRASTRVEYGIVPRVRGDRELGAGVVLLRSPLGFWRRRFRFGAGEIVRVYPDASRFLRPEALRPEKVFATLGVRPARKRGEGMDFESLRDYVPGDDPRRVDWAATARRGRPITRLYQHERNHTVLIALDSSRLMGARFEGRAKLDYAVDAALALAYAALTAGDRVGMTVFDREVRGHVAPRSRRGELGRFVDLLRPMHARVVEPDFDAFLRLLAVRQRQRALVVLFTDFADAEAASFTAPLSLIARHHRLLLVAVRDPIYDRLAPAPRDPHEEPIAFYRRLVVDDLLHERESTLGALRRRGAQTLDLVPDAMTAPVLNRYLALRYGAER